MTTLHADRSLLRKRLEGSNHRNFCCYIQVQPGMVDDVRLYQSAHRPV
jgi:hypothetical protein